MKTANNQNRFRIAFGLLALSTCLTGSQALAGQDYCSIKPYNNVVDSGILKRIESGPIKQQSDALVEFRNQAGAIAKEVTPRKTKLGGLYWANHDLAQLPGAVHSDFKANCSAISKIDGVAKTVGELASAAPAGVFRSDMESQQKKLTGIRDRLDAFCKLGYLEKRSQKQVVQEVKDQVESVHERLTQLPVTVATNDDFDRCHSDRIANLSAAQGVTSLPGNQPNKSAPLPMVSTDRPDKGADYSEASDAAAGPKKTAGGANGNWVEKSH